MCTILFFVENKQFHLIIACLMNSRGNLQKELCYCEKKKLTVLCNLTFLNNFYIFPQCKVRMYQKYSEQNSWKFSVVASSLVMSLMYNIKHVPFFWCLVLENFLCFSRLKKVDIKRM